MITSLDFKLPDGKVDWKAYTEAQTANGERCHKCGSFIVMGSGKPSLCYQCRYLKSDPGERLHDRLLRCPHCGHTSEAVGDGQYSRYQEGEHTATCYECEKDFTFTTHVAYSFTSPPLQSANAEKAQTVKKTEGSANPK